MPQSVTKTQSKWCINKHGASKIIDMFETYQWHRAGKHSGLEEQEERVGSGNVGE
jgi:hypothetical protein